MRYKQDRFSGGINLIQADIDIPPDGYYWLINGRQRFGYLEAINQNLLIENLPTGNRQGVIAVGDVLIAFVDGTAHYKIEGDDFFSPIGGFSMSASAERFWTQAVPAATFLFKRKLNTTLSANDPMLLTSNFKISGNLAGIVVQDGETQPWIIFYDPTTRSMSARVTKTYADWSNTSTTADDREYVPIGRQMMFFNGKLYIVSRDKKSLYQSVSNRPLDFMINVDVNGNKLPAEGNGGVTSTSFSFDSDDITCIFPTNAQDVFIYGTANNIRMIQLDYTRTIFGEPTYRENTAIAAGIVNQDSIAEILGDLVFVDFEGISRFNAVLQIKNEGRNSVFSKQLSLFLDGIRQTNPQVVAFDNYILFNITTKIGNLVAVWDTLSEQWISLDITDVVNVKQFAVVNTDEDSFLYALLDNDKLLKMYSGSSREMMQLHTRSFHNEDTTIEQKDAFLRVLCKSGTQEGEITAIEYVDNKLGPLVQSRKTKDLKGEISAVLYPVQTPVIPHTQQLIDSVTFNFKNGLTGTKVAFIIQVATDARIYEFMIDTTDLKRDQALKATSAVLT